MPWRLIGFILTFTVFLIFILSNLNNRCDITFIIQDWTVRDVPVFVTIFASFLLGLIFSIPVYLSISLKKKRAGDKALKNKKGKKGAESDESLETYEVR